MNQRSDQDHVLVDRQAALSSLLGSVALVQFLAVKDRDAFASYRSASQSTVEGAGGRRLHGVDIDQVLAGGPMSFNAITVDAFPSGAAARNAFEAVSAERRAVLADVYVLIVRLGARQAAAGKALSCLRPILSRVLGTGTEREMIRFAAVADPETGPVPETIAVLRAHDQTTPFYMMNLNKYYPDARYEDGESLSGERAYNRYGYRILPYLASVGGYPTVYGRVLGVYVGDEGGVLHDNWSDFAMVRYPSRAHFLRMMSNTPMGAARHRTAGLERAVLMPSSVWG